MRPEKESIVNEIREYLEDIDYVFLVDYRGLTVEQLTDLRGQLGRSHTRFQIVKNAFLRRVVDHVGWDGMSAFLEGPTAVIIGEGDVTQTAKVLRNFKAENNLPMVKGGRLGDRLLSPEDIEEMSRIPSRDVLLGRLIGTICVPMIQLVGLMEQKVSGLLYVLRAIKKGMKKDSEENKS